jgi:hypothetical protein
MSETYDYPDTEDVPQITTATSGPFEQPETKHLFITYDTDEWESERQVEETLKVINSLFGTDVQIAILPNDYDLLSESDVREMLEKTNGDS